MTNKQSNISFVKKIKFLLLLVMTIVTQGVWGQEAPKPEGTGIEKNPYIIGVGDWTVSLPYQSEISFSNWEGLTSIGSYTIFKFEAPRDGTLQIISYASKSIQYALFDENKAHLCHSASGQVMDFYADIESGKTYYIGMRAQSVTEKLMTVKLYCKKHENSEIIPRTATCTEDGTIEHILCHDCGGRFSNDEEQYLLNDWTLNVNAPGHDMKEGVCTRCGFSFTSLKLDEDNSCSVGFENNYVYENDPCTVYRVYTPSENWHGIVSVSGTYTSDWANIRLIDRYTFESEPKKIEKAPRRSPENGTEDGEDGEEDGVGHFDECGTLAFSPYIYVVLYHDGEGIANLTFTFEDHKDYLTILKDKAEARGCIEGHHALYQCTHERCGGEWPSTYFTEEGVFSQNLNQLDLVIPATDDHNLNDKGVCTVCGQKPVLDDGENTVKFFKGDGIVTAFKYVATDTKSLNVTVETNATIDNMGIMLWSEWEPSYDDEKPLSAPRKVSGTKEVAPLMTMNVVAGQEYAILFATSAENDEDATITLSYTEVVYPEVEVGENIIDIAAVDGGRDQNPENYNIFKFVAPKSGEARFYTQGSSDTYGMLFDSNFKVLTSDDDNGDGSNFKFVNKVVKGNVYYVGMRSYGGGYIGEYTLVIEIEGLPEFEGTLELATVNADNTVIENDPWDSARGLFPTDDKFYVNFVALGGVTYKRNTTTSRWGTVILPYELKSNDEVTYYQLSVVGDDKMTFSPVETVPANTPTVYRFNKEADSYQYDASTTEATEMEFVNVYEVNSNTAVEGWNMVGFYGKTVYDYAGNLERIRYISKDKFMSATKSVTINPYRAVFWYTGEQPQKVKTFVIAIADDEADGIQAIVTEDGIEEVEAIYDLNGRKQSALGKGVNIIRTADGKTRKIIQK